MIDDAVREFLQSFGAWIAFAAFILLMRLIGTIGNRVWKQDHEYSDREHSAHEEMSSPTKQK